MAKTRARKMHTVV